MIESELKNSDKDCEPIQSTNDQKTGEQSSLTLKQTQPGPENQKAQREDSESDSGSDWDVSEVKPKWDPRPKWLRDTDELLEKFNETHKKLASQKVILTANLKEYQANKQIASKRAEDFHKLTKLIQMEQSSSKYKGSASSRLESLHCGLMIQIYQFIGEDIYLVATKYRRVSRTFNAHYFDTSLFSFCLNWYLGIDCQNIYESQQQCEKIHKTMIQATKGYFKFKKTLLYYKSIDYTKDLPPNSFKNDLIDSLKFINDVHRHAILARSLLINYFQLVNQFLLKHQFLIALEVLSVINVPTLRRSAIQVLVNHLAFNPSLRTSKHAMAKPLLNKLLGILEQPQERIPLIYNTWPVQRLLDPIVCSRGLCFVDDDIKKMHYTLPLEVAGVCTLQIIDFRNVTGQRCQVETVNLEFQSEIVAKATTRTGFELRIKLGTRGEDWYLRDGQAIYTFNRGEYFLSVGRQNQFQETWVFAHPDFIVLPRFHH